MESTGRAGKVQLSQQTANELARCGHEDWCWAREDVVYAKGKGELQTYWLDLFDQCDPLCANPLNDSSNMIREKTETEEDTTESLALNDENERLINWVVERLSQLLKKIVSSISWRMIIT
jgi:Adenylate and Guanylate cyclase catalytic domain